MFFDTEIQVLSRTSDDFSKSGDMEKAMLALEAMKSKFEELEEKYKDKHMRKKLGKCTFQLSRIFKSEVYSMKERATSMKDWIENESSIQNIL